LKPARRIWIVAGAFALAAVGGGIASAAPNGPTGDTFSQHDSFTPSNQTGPNTTHRSLQFDWQKNRWGLNLDVSQQGDRDTSWRDARIGLNYRVAPGLRTGASVTLGPEHAPDGDMRNLAPQEPAPRVRLETTFKF